MTSREPVEVDYRVRPAKQAERAMIGNLVAHVGQVEPWSSFRYVGMGSIYFVDFVLMHRRFGIDDMISIEGRDEILERCKFNMPYGCITLFGGTVASALPELRSDQPTIMWLDYTGSTTEDRLEEVRVATGDLATPSLFLVTTDITVPREEGRVEWFRKCFGDRDSGSVTKASDLNRKKFPSRIWSYVDAAIRDGVSDRRDGAAYEQLLHIWYSDGAAMLTIGGLIYEDEDQLSAGEFGRLDFVRHGDGALKLRIPKLTYRERAELDRLLPAGDLGKMPVQLEDADLEAYASLYRFAPFYVDVQV